MTRRDQKISIALNLREIISVIESLPEGSDLLPTLRNKAEILLALYKLKHRERKAGEPVGHEIWCLVSRYEVVPGETFPWCTCRANVRI